MGKHCTVHKDGHVSIWSVTLQSWRRRVRHVPDEDLAALPPRDRERVTIALRTWCRRCHAPAHGGMFNGPCCDACRARIAEELKPWHAERAAFRLRARMGDQDARDVLGGYDEWHDRFDSRGDA